MVSSHPLGHCRLNRHGPQLKDQQNQPVRLSPNWTALILLLVIAVANEIIIALTDASILNLFAFFFRYGYSAMGGGQVVIPLMISDLVDSQSLISLEDFLAGYAIDQAVPGPLFSFAAFVSARAMAGSGFSFLAGMIGGLAIFLPGILLVFFMFLLWKSMRDHTLMKFFLKGVTVAVASLIIATAIQSTLALDFGWVGLGLTLVGTLLLLSKKVPAPLIVLLAAILGFIA